MRGHQFEGAGTKGTGIEAPQLADETMSNRGGAHGRGGVKKQIADVTEKPTALWGSRTPSRAPVDRGMAADANRISVEGLAKKEATGQRAHRRAPRVDHVFA